MPTRTLITIVIVIFIVLSSQPSVVCAASDRIASPILNFSNTEQTLTAQVDKGSLHTVLQVLANRLAITITLRGVEENTHFSTHFSNLPLEQGIERLLHGLDYALLYSRVHASQPAQLKEMIVLARPHSSTHTLSTETEIMMLPMNHQSEFLKAHTQPHNNSQKHEKSDWTALAETVETLGQLIDQKPRSSLSPFEETINDQESEIRSTATALLKELESSSE